MRWLRLRRRRSDAPEEDTPPWLIAHADLPPLVYAVGDLHGCLGPYRRLEALIAEEARSRAVEGLVVLLGDLVDRGPETAALLDHLLAPPPAGLKRLALKGNHEDKMLQFLDAPRRHADWLGWGGVETLLSYGMAPDPVYGFDRPEKRLRQLLDAHIPGEHVAFLRGLPMALRMGSYYLCHAGIDPARPLDDQAARDLLWRREMTAPPPEGITLVHGHTPVAAVDPTGPVINVDTGAYSTGRLSALRLAPGEAPEVLSVQ